MDFSNIISSSVEECINSLPTVALLLLAAMALLALIQIYLRVFVWRVSKPKGSIAIDPSQLPAISVVLVVHENDELYIEKHLHELLNQKYHTFEIVLVDCSYNEQITEQIAALALRDYRLKSITIRRSSNFDNSEKLALNIGFKSASYEHLLVTTTTCSPVSDMWIESMASKFIHPRAEIVIGYSSIEPTGKFHNYFMRSSRLLSGMGYISAAREGAAYRGSRHNMAYTKSLYFENKGFSHLNMNIGENDLFVQKVAHRGNTIVNIDTESAVKEVRFSSFSEIFYNDVLRSSTHPLYPLNIRFRRNFELFTRALFYAIALTIKLFFVVEAIGGNIYIPAYIAFVVLFIARLIAILVVAHKAGGRLSDRGLTPFFIIYDIFSPIYDFGVWLSRTMLPNRGVWR